MNFNSFPKDYHENMLWRSNILAKCASDLEFRNEVKQLFHRDILFAFNAFFFTLDVRETPYHHQPFATWDYQDEFILTLQDHIMRGEDLIVEKSRDMGVSWMVMLVFEHFWLDPVGGSDFLAGSRVEDYVDKKGDPRTLFEKLRYLNAKLPRFLLPVGYEVTKHDNYMRLQNPEGGSTITGESNNANFGTGGRYRAILMDEFAKWENTDVAAWTSSGDATPSRIAVSTPFGASGQFYRLISEGLIKRITLHWSLHPRKGYKAYCRYPKEDALSDLHLIRSPWFDGQTKRRSELEVAQELQIDYVGAGRPVFDGLAGKILVKWFNQEQLDPIYYNLDKGTETKIDSRSSFEGVLRIYEWYDKECDYVVAVDVAEGLEQGDYSAIIVFNRTTMDVDAVYHAKTNEVKLAHYAYKIGMMYCEHPDDPIDGPFMAIETLGPGLSTFDRVSSLGYVKLFMMPRFDKVTQAVSHRKGWRTDAHSRKTMISSIRDYIEGEHGYLNYKQLISELMTFVKDKTGKPVAKTGCYDDLVMAFGIALGVHQILPDMRTAKKDYKSSYEYDINRVQLKDLKLENEETVEDKCFNQAAKRQLERVQLERNLFH